MRTYKLIRGEKYWEVRFRNKTYYMWSTPRINPLLSECLDDVGFKGIRLHKDERDEIMFLDDEREDKLNKLLNG